MLPSRMRSPAREDRNLFSVHVSDTLYHENMHHVLVTVSNRTAEGYILGVLLQPRLVGCDGPDVDHNVGEFEMLETDNYFRFLNCRKNPKGTVVTNIWTGKPYSGDIKVNFVIANTRRKLKFRATIISQDGQLYVNNDSEEIRYIPVSGVDPDDSKECPRIKALPFVSDSGASSDYRSGFSISSAILFLLSYMLSCDISNILF
nr:uncharacterized protein LOC111118644 isoform X2 [Crassostrea virginica]